MLESINKTGAVVAAAVVEGMGMILIKGLERKSKTGFIHVALKSQLMCNLL